ncbi:MAG: hypothetical protein ACJA1F_002883 [Paracoccaceae bacterium]|jgi:hypothetical protein
MPGRSRKLAIMVLESMRTFFSAARLGDPINSESKVAASGTVGKATMASPISVFAQ